MSDKLRSYIKENKEKFDSAEPSKDLWKTIDSKLELSVPVSKSKWTYMKYFGLGVCVIVITVYFISQNLNNSSSKALSQNLKDSALNSSGVWVKTNQNDGSVNTNDNSVSSSGNNKVGTDNFTDKNAEKEQNSLIRNDENIKKDSVVTDVDENISSGQKVEIDPVPVKEENTAMSNLVKNKSKKIIAPEAPSEMNTFNATIYDCSSICEVIQAYRFPGKVSMNGERNYQGHRILETVPCSKLENAGNVKAVWVKGKVSKKLSLSVTQGLKSITLVKSDGSKVPPVALSHYYKGLGVISDYTGKHFEMTFKDNMELILFFKDVNEGDKVMIDGKIEAVVNTK